MAEKNSKREKIEAFKDRANQLRSEYKEDKEAFLQKYKKEETPMLMSMASPSYQFGSEESKYKTLFCNNEEMIKNFNEIKG